MPGPHFQNTLHLIGCRVWAKARIWDLAHSRRSTCRGCSPQVPSGILLVLLGQQACSRGTREEEEDRTLFCFLPLLTEPSARRPLAPHSRHREPEAPSSSMPLPDPKPCPSAGFVRHPSTACPAFPLGNRPTYVLNPHGKGARTLAGFEGGSVTQIWLFGALFPCRH